MVRIPKVQNTGESAQQQWRWQCSIGLAETGARELVRQVLEEKRVTLGIADNAQPDVVWQRQASRGDVVPGRILGIVDHAVTVAIGLQSHVDVVERDQPDRRAIRAADQ